MARPERPVDPDAGPVQWLAHELRALRQAAGSPAYRTMARTAGFSATTLSQAAGGERLPSLAVVQGYVRACGGDVGAWEPRWKEARTAVEEAPAPAVANVQAPYRGLSRFEPDDQALFFGRDRMVDELKQLVWEHRFAVLFGASGSGKSSLLRAGLIPRLSEEVARLESPAALRILTPGHRPATTYGHLLAPAEGEPESWVVVDQFEEAFTLCRDRTERTRFFDLLLAARDPESRVRVLIAVRADFYARCAEHRDLANALHHAGLLLSPMTADELREVVVRPAQAVGLRVERELTARLVEEVLDEPGGLPMLSHVLLETWRRRRGGMLTLAAYQAVGGVHGAIAASAEQVYGKLDADHARTARQLLLRMVEPGQGTPDTRRPLLRAELAEWSGPHVSLVVDRLARARLLTADEEGVQLAHEALITCWPRLHGWIEEDRERLRHQRQLTEAARTWLEHDRDPGVLYRGSRLARAKELFADDDGMLTTTEQDYLTSALAARDAESRTAARAARRRRALLGTLSAVLAVALVAVLVAWTQHRDNQRRRTDAAARRIAQVADALRTTDPRTAQLLGLAAWHVAELPETRLALLGALAQPETDTFTDPKPGSSPTRFLIHSGRTLLAADGGTWRTWDVATHRRLASGPLPDGTVVDAGPDGRLLVIAGDDDVRLWDTSTGRWTGTTLPTDTAVGFGADGSSYTVIGPDDDRVRLLSATDGAPLFETWVADPAGAAPSTDGRLTAVCLSGHAPQVWDTARRRALPGAWEDSGVLCDDDHSIPVFGGPGAGADRFAVISSSGVHVWDAASGRLIADLADPGVRSVAFSADGAFLATSDDSEISVWRLASAPAPVFRHPLNNEDLYGGLAWDPDRPLLRYLEGGTVHTLDLAGAVSPAWRDDPLNMVRLSPDGRTLATAEGSRTGYRFQLRDTRDGHVLRTLPPVPLPLSRDSHESVAARDTVALMALSPEGDTLAYGVSAPGLPVSAQRFTLWDLARGRARTTLDLATPQSGGSVVTLALGPGGHALYAARIPGAGELSDEVWDTARHRQTAVYPDAAGTALAIRPDGRLLVGSSRTVRLPSGTVHTHDLIQGDEIGAFAFTPDGSLLAAGDLTGRVALWDGSLRHRAGVLRSVFPTPLGDSAETISALAVSPDGRTLAVGGTAGTLQLWDIATQQPLSGPLTTPGDAIASLAFSRDSTTLVAAGRYVPLQRYTIDPAQAGTRICARTGDANLTRAQWHTYVPDAPYRKVCGH
ncbi:WD40 repeat domain-containing protein [Streptomyces sp. NPDC020951]|uniref:WD40 repeat domain-containing protein n=1 Tax=Streptomyces sp. NPDC020951 TaxID=3365104 RepID=UPI0037A67185